MPGYAFLRRSFRTIAGLMLPSLLLVNCGSEPRLPSGAPIEIPVAPATGSIDLAAAIAADLTCLYLKAAMLPDEASSVGAFRTIRTLVEGGEAAEARLRTSQLVAFVQQRYAAYGKKNSTTPCGVPNGTMNVTTLTERTITRLTAYASLTGIICEIPVGSPATYCRSAERDGALVYFPPDLFNRLTYVSVTENPADVTRLQDLGFDEYPNILRIETQPIADFRAERVKPLVVVCYNNALLPTDPVLRERLLLGHRHAGANGAVSFKLLPPPDFGPTGYGSAVLDELNDFCSTGPSAAGGPSGAARALLGRLGDRVTRFLAPAPLNAAVLLAIGGGVGGSAEEFSEFGAVDRGLLARGGGVGGSAEEFVRLQPTRRALDSYTGRAGVDVAVTDPARLPSVRVVAPGSNATPVAGVRVHFALIDPLTATPASGASLCGTASAITDASGEARPACINFGASLGFKNLRVTFDPSDVDPLACILGALGSCATASTSVNFLLETVAGPAARLGLLNAPGATTARAGVVMVPQPRLQLLDLAGAAVTDLTADVAVTATVRRVDGTSGGVLTSFGVTTNRTAGQIQLDGFALGGIVGTTYEVRFGGSGLTAAVANIRITAGGNPALVDAAPASASAQAGGPIPVIATTVTDAYGNLLSGVAVTAASADLQCLAGNGCLTRTTTAAGVAPFTDLTIRGPGSSRVLHFAVPGAMTGVVPVALTPGPAASISPEQRPDYGTGLAIGPVSPSPTVRVSDAYGNAVDDAPVLWSLLAGGSGATISASSTGTSSGGLASVTWNLAAGENRLGAFLETLAGPSVTFAGTAQFAPLSLTCGPSGNLTAVQLTRAAPSSMSTAIRFAMQPELAAPIRRVRLTMSVISPVRTPSVYPALLQIYRGSIAPANLIGTGVPFSGTGLSLQGSGPGEVEFLVTPNPAAPTAGVGNDNLVVFELVVQAPAADFVNLWHNSASGTGTCASSRSFRPLVTDFTTLSPVDIVAGLLISVGN